MKELPQILSLEEVSKILRVSKETLRRWDNNGYLIAIRVNKRGDRRYTKKQILEFLGEE